MPDVDHNATGAPETPHMAHRGPTQEETPPETTNCESINYVENVKEQLSELDAAIWAKVSSDSNVINALTKMINKIASSNDEKTCYASMNRLLCEISLALHDHRNVMDKLKMDDDMAVMWLSTDTKILQGAYMQTARNPDGTSIVVQRARLLEELESLRAGTNQSLAKEQDKAQPKQSDGRKTRTRSKSRAHDRASVKLPTRVMKTRSSRPATDATSSTSASASASAPANPAAASAAPIVSTAVVTAGADDSTTGEAAQSTLEERTTAATNAFYTGTQSQKHVYFAEAASFVEIKYKSDNEGQWMNYAKDLWRYRPDMSIVHGLYMANQQIGLVSCEACDMWTSKQYGIRSNAAEELLAACIAHVFLVYQSLGSRLKTLRARTDIIKNGVVYEFEIDSKVLYFAPFQAKRPPGRGSIVGHILNVEGKNAAVEEIRAAYTAPAKGIIKLSYQSKHDHESHMYRQAHGQGRAADEGTASKNEFDIPGLAKLRWSKCYPAMSTRPLEVGKPSPQLEVIILDSVGDPFHTCKTPREMINAVYVLLIYLEKMLMRDVMHRDISATNVLVGRRQTSCDVTMQTPEDPVERDIENVLGKDPKVLITDMDHAIGYKIRGEPGSVSRTGTPLFTAGEAFIVDGVPIQWSRKNFSQSVGLPDVLFPQHRPPTFDKAFELDPKRHTDGLGTLYDDEQFKALLAKISTETKNLLEEELVLRVPIRHRPRFDAESCFWILVWFLVRAWPTSEKPENKDFHAESCAYSSFVTNMLINNAPTAAHRHDNFPLHSKLAALKMMLEDMQTYLFSIPWYQFEEGGVQHDHSLLQIHPAHAFVALRRIILYHLTKDSEPMQKALDVKLYTRRPRPCATSIHGSTFPQANTINQRSLHLVQDMRNASSSTRNALLIGRPSLTSVEILAQSQTGCKRSREVEDDDDETNAKSRGSGKAAKLQHIPSAADEESAVNDIPMTDQLPKNDAMGLRLLMLIDQNHWLGAFTGKNDIRAPIE
ncbi:hypothetical protein BKA62DRAFT_808966 [Auriculariales sp. MPI-PUGE-AT-0066]|nr:hypothetical protein BKA62DRAFT_808966 [Auriculariales sp. MPI-PUGE-AT-0066]